MKPKLDLNKIAKSLGAIRRGKITSRGGYFSALQLLADTKARFRYPQPRRPRQAQDNLICNTPPGRRNR